MAQTTTMTLTDFLTARLDEDEAAARAARDEAPALTWAADKVYDGVYGIDLGPATHPDADSYDVGDELRMPREMAQHIARHDPARILREVEAKRAIVALHSPADEDIAAWRPDRCSRCDEDYGCDTLQHLAAIYSDHPDYDEGWRP